MRWLAGLPKWVLAGTLVLLAAAEVLGVILRIALFGVPVLVLFWVYFATLMAFVVRRDRPRPPSPH